jgi:hypothetical protein
MPEVYVFILFCVFLPEIKQVFLPGFIRKYTGVVIGNNRFS